MHYDISYRFLFLRIARLAAGRIDTTEGLWRNRATGERVPVMLSEFDTHTMDREDEERRRARMSIHNTIFSVLTTPRLDTIYYVKRRDEHINPLFGAESRARFLEVYDLESGLLRFFRRDLLAGTETTNLVGTTDIARQGREIATMLRTMSDVFYGGRNLLGKEDGFRVYVNIEGVVTPFLVTTVLSETPMPIMGRRIPALRVDVEPAPKAHGRGRNVTIWMTSLKELAARVGAPELVALAAENPSWSMVPLVADYGLAIGYMRGHMTDIRILPRAFP